MERAELIEVLKENHSTFMKGIVDAQDLLKSKYEECNYFYSTVLDSDLSKEEIQMCLSAIMKLYEIRNEGVNPPDLDNREELYVENIKTKEDLLDAIKTTISDIESFTTYVDETRFHFHAQSMYMSGIDLKGKLEEVKKRLANGETKSESSDIESIYDEDEDRKSITLFENLFGQQKEFDELMGRN